MTQSSDDRTRRAQMLERLWEEARQIGCPPDAGPVLAEGTLDARLMLVGEAPGAQEVRRGRPFAGPAGSLLDRLLEETGIERSQVWITNVVKCRPMTEANGRPRNRQPTAGEQKQWRSLLQREIEILQPEVIVALGATAARAMFGSKFKLTQERGEWRETNFGIPGLATFHPAYALHLEGIASDQAIATMLLDLRKVATRLYGTVGTTGRELPHGEDFPADDYEEQGHLFD